MDTQEQAVIDILKMPTGQVPHFLSRFLLQQRVLIILFDRYLSMKRGDYTNLIDYYTWLLEFLLNLKVFLKLWSSFRYFGAGFTSPWIRRPVCLLSPFYSHTQQIVFSSEDDTALETAALFSYLLKNEEKLFQFKRADSNFNIIRWALFLWNEKVEEEVIESGLLVTGVIFMIVSSISRARIESFYKENELETLLFVIQKYAQERPDKKLEPLHTIMKEWYAERSWDLDILKTNLQNKGYIIT